MAQKIRKPAAKKIELTSEQVLFTFNQLLIIQLLQLLM